MLPEQLTGSENQSASQRPMNSSPSGSLPRRPVNRRKFLATLAAASAATRGRTQIRAQESAPFPPVRQITRGPGFHWFAYYDKLQFSPDNRFVLSNKAHFENRSPGPEDVIEVGMVDLHHKDEWIPLGTTRAWCWQQGCMLQWIPGSASEVIWNDREQDRFVSHILNVNTREKRTLPAPIYALSPNGKTAVSCDFARVADCRPGYGYAGVRDRFSDSMAPAESGVTRIDLDTGREQLLISHDQVTRMGEIPRNLPDSKHHFYHLLWSPDGRRFIFLHRWTQPGGGQLSRMFTAAPDGTDLRIVIPNGAVSHFIWRDPTHLLAQSKDWLGNPGWGNFLFEDRDAGILGEVGRGVLDSGGHFTYLRDNRWILNDTYPQGEHRLQKPHLYEIQTHRRIDLGHFTLHPAYRGEWRVDTHPRLSRDERMVCIDSPYTGQGRQLHLLDISHLA